MISPCGPIGAASEWHPSPSRKGRTPSPGQYAEDKELIGILTECFKKLSDNDRRIIVLKDLEGLNYDEIAEVLSINLGTVKSRLSRARDRLKEMMKEYL